jgi:uncharacterized membrane protein (DUF106 family)
VTYKFIEASEMEKKKSRKSKKSRRSGKAMRMQFKPYSKRVLLFLLISFFLWSCGDQKEASKAPVVSKKISVQSYRNRTRKARTPEGGSVG